MFNPRVYAIPRTVKRLPLAASAAWVRTWFAAKPEKNFATSLPLTIVLLRSPRHVLSGGIKGPSGRC